MVSGLRAEDVKAAIDWYDDGGLLDGPAGVKAEDHLAAFVAAARKWLASQEQTPDRVWECWNCDGDTRCTSQEEADELDRLWPKTAPHADCGFLPQPEGDER